MQYRYQDLICLFEQTFYSRYNTKLIKGGEEPIYLPADDHCHYHQIQFARGYFNSALHETAHWCIAGPARQHLVDWGYWYLPDGRTAKQQTRFEQVEVKPQAIEWAFCLAIGLKFNESADNLSGEETDRLRFRAEIAQQLRYYFLYGFPAKAQLFIDALINFYQPNLVWSVSCLNEQENLCEPV